MLAETSERRSGNSGQGRTRLNSCRQLQHQGEHKYLPGRQEHRTKASMGLPCQGFVHRG